MKTNRGISMRSQNGSNNIDFNLEPNTNAGMLFARNVASGQAPVQVLPGTSGKQAYGFEAPYQKMFDIVNAISASGGGLPTEDAVVNFVNANKGAKMSFQASIGSNVEFAVPHNATHIIYSGIPFTVVINSISYSNVHILFKFGPNAYAAPAVMIKSDGSVSARTGTSFTTLKCSAGSGTGNYIYKVSFEN